jgi:molybdenum transport protein
MEMFYFTDAEIDQYITDDVPYFDITTHLCKLDLNVTLSFFTRECGIISGVEEAVKIFKKLECGVGMSKNTCDTVEAGEALLSVNGKAKNIMAGWKATQNMIEYASGIATLTDKVVKIAKNVAPNIEVVATRKTMPGAKKLLTKAIMAGGASPHRLGLSETILFFEQHIELIGGWDIFCDGFQEIKHHAKEKKIDPISKPPQSYKYCRYL